MDLNFIKTEKIKYSQIKFINNMQISSFSYSKSYQF